MKIHRRFATVAFAVFFLMNSAPRAFAQNTLDGIVLFPGSGAGVLPSNSVSHLGYFKGILWAGTGRGLAGSTTGGRTWVDFSAVPQFGGNGIFSLDGFGDTVWASTGFSKDVNGSSVQTGSGYAVSTDAGSSWSSLPQPLDARDDSSVSYGLNHVRFLPIVVPEQNVTFDVALGRESVWIASWSSGIRTSTDLGRSWHRVVLPNKSRQSIKPSDTLGTYVMDPRSDNNFLGFSVALQGNDTVWAGTAGGVNRSTDGGTSWQKFTATNQASHILSDWVIAIGVQHLNGKTRVWTTNWPAEGPNQQYGVSYTDDGGATWVNQLVGVKAFGFSFRDSITYIPTVNGVYRTSDGGASWFLSGTIIDPATGNRITTSTFYSTASIGDTVFAASSDGIVRTIDSPSNPFGASWSIIRAYQPSGSTSTTYSYPNPFNPSTQACRIHYTTGTSSALVTIEVFDFGMNRVRTVINGATRTGESDEIWDGRTDSGLLAVNGVYFYRVTSGNGTPAWGKILVLR
jgi:hypothetical protein